MLRFILIWSFVWAVDIACQSASATIQSESTILSATEVMPFFGKYTMTYKRYSVSDVSSIPGTSTNTIIYRDVVLLRRGHLRRDRLFAGMNFQLLLGNQLYRYKESASPRTGDISCTRTTLDRNSRLRRTPPSVEYVGNEEIMYNGRKVVAKLYKSKLHSYYYYVDVTTKFPLRFGSKDSKNVFDVIDFNQVVNERYFSLLPGIECHHPTLIFQQ